MCDSAVTMYRAAIVMLTDVILSLCQCLMIVLTLQLVLICPALPVNCLVCVSTEESAWP